MIVQPPTTRVAAGSFLAPRTTCSLFSMLMMREKKSPAELFSSLALPAAARAPGRSRRAREARRANSPVAPKVLGYRGREGSR